MDEGEGGETSYAGRETVGEPTDFLQESIELPVRSVFQHEIEALVVMKYIVHGQDEGMIEFKAGLGFNFHLFSHGVFVDFALV